MKTKDTKEQLLLLIDDLQKDKNFENVRVYNSDDEAFEFYLSISGKCNEYYFSVIIFKSIFSENESVNTSLHSKHKTIVNNKLKQFKLL